MKIWSVDAKSESGDNYGPILFRLKPTQRQLKDLVRALGSDDEDDGPGDFGSYIHLRRASSSRGHRKLMTHWEALARGLLFTHGNDVGNRVTLDFEQAAKIIAKALGEAYLQGRKDEDAAWLGKPVERLFPQKDSKGETTNYCNDSACGGCHRLGH